MYTHTYIDSRLWREKLRVGGCRRFRHHLRMPSPWLSIIFNPHTVCQKEKKNGILCTVLYFKSRSPTIDLFDGLFISITLKDGEIWEQFAFSMPTIAAAYFQQHTTSRVGFCWMEDGRDAREQSQNVQKQDEPDWKRQPYLFFSLLPLSQFHSLNLFRFFSPIKKNKTKTTTQLTRTVVPFGF